MTAQWKRRAERAEERQSYEEIVQLARADPRGRVVLICGRCGEWQPSDGERTIYQHYQRAHGRTEARLVGSFEWMHSVGYGPLDEEEEDAR